MSTVGYRIKDPFAVKANQGGQACHSQRQQQADQVFHLA